MNSEFIRIVVVVPSKLGVGVIKSQLYDFFKGIYGLEVIYVSTRKDDVGFDVLRYESMSALAKGIRKLDPTYVYIRSITDYFSVYKRVIGSSIKVIYSFRSFLFAESYFKNRKLSNATVLYVMEMLAYLTAYRLTGVTKVLRQKSWKYFLVKRKMLVTPCYCSEDFVWDYSKCGNNEIKFVYVGGASKWQCVEETLNLYSDIYSVYNTSLTIYTGDQGAFLNAIKDFPSSCQSSIEIKSVPREQLLNELPSYDIGFLLRQDDVVNKVASPIKLYEYCGAGVLPLTTPYVGDVSSDYFFSKVSFSYRFDQKSLKELLRKLSAFKENQQFLLDELKQYNKQNSIEESRKQFKNLL